MLGGFDVCPLQEATGGAGVDIIVEMLSNVNLSKDLQMMAFGGRVTVSMSPASVPIGVHSQSVEFTFSRQVVGARGSIEINPRDTMAKESSIMGVALFCATQVTVLMHRNAPLQVTFHRAFPPKGGAENEPLKK